jgi:hypothetical protein
MCPLYAFHAQSELVQVARTCAGHLGMHYRAHVCTMAETESVHVLMLGKVRGDGGQRCWREQNGTGAYDTASARARDSQKEHTTMCSFCESQAHAQYIP